MSDRSTNSQKSRQKQARTARLGAALRDNLKRRKAQARGRDAEGRTTAEPAAPGEAHETAGFAPDKRTR